DRLTDPRRERLHLELRAGRAERVLAEEREDLRLLVPRDRQLGIQRVRALDPARHPIEERALLVVERSAPAHVEPHVDARELEEVARVAPLAPPWEDVDRAARILSHGGEPLLVARAEHRR